MQRQFRVRLRHKYGAAVEVDGEAAFAGSASLRTVQVSFTLDERVEGLGLVSVNAGGGWGGLWRHAAGLTAAACLLRLMFPASASPDGGSLHPRCPLSPTPPQAPSCTATPPLRPCWDSRRVRGRCCAGRRFFLQAPALSARMAPRQATQATWPHSPCPASPLGGAHPRRPAGQAPGAD